MSNTGLVAWGVPRLAELLPLDQESLTQIIDYAASLSKEEGANHLKNLLGDSPAAFEFIAAFSSRRSAPPPQRSAASSPAPTSAPAPSSTSSAPPRNTSSSSGRKGKKSKPPLHSAGPVRRPENFGDVTGGYRKEDQIEDYMPVSMSGRGRPDAKPSLGLRNLPVTTSQGSSATSSRNQSPAPPRPTSTTTTTTSKNNKAPPSAAGPVISDLLPNVKSKAAKSTARGAANAGGGGSSSSSSAKGGGALTTTNITDLTAAIAALEVSTNPTLGPGARKCTCYASIHPLFDPAPNCLNCGKIICALEGLQPCSFCGTPLLSSDEVQSMIRELRAERGQEKMRAHNESVQHRDGGPGLGPGSNSTSNNKLDAARAHRDKLLQFQAQNAKRTRVVDEAADFETPNVASTLWMTPAQRALALKKQQRIMREMEEKARPEWEKKKTIMSLDIKGGRVTRVYQSAAEATGSAKAAEEGEDEDDNEAKAAQRDEADRANSGGHAFSNNPLLAAGGLLRPVWKTADGKQPETARKERQPTWRRVQDDNDDNEQWILDGGAHGYT
ncbi:zf-C2HC5-domain-containing protein [Aspergillus brunneoviolaceus CBS 621.78]|uniref:Zf-C2HC5-domain-containing protein n=1 Tax=Aspergillus brunneoviolaceus CBS 621.78 TaxID=1450534 RepID=A0ACD1G0I3_9EURO|nr:zf-C2HC5-domain-containing protein [Aspergillus brunneoviolaceus CBS 621.78]RAH42678.1 zf-C2HC5-domain-containing protein [Aspergillus brunneoviolaceus CBS 621.78]